jgi:hypothetical protein
METITNHVFLKNLVCLHVRIYKIVDNIAHNINLKLFRYAVIPILSRCFWAG